MLKRVIVDTDIGSDVDDCLALALALASPEVVLEGITCVYGDVLLRSRMVLKLLALRGRRDISVSIGASKPLLGLQPIYWEGHEGYGLLEPEDSALTPADVHAVDFIVDRVMANPGEIHLVAIGPLTNVALALLKEPRLASELASLTIMGGAVRGIGDLGLPYAEHNIKCDPEAAHVVFSSGAPITLIPLDVTTKVEVDRDGVRQIRGGATPFHDAVARQVDLYPRFAGSGSTFLHDPLALATVIRPDLVAVEQLHMTVELQSREAAGMTLAMTPTTERPGNMDVALKVDANRFREFFLGRLAS